MPEVTRPTLTEEEYAQVVETLCSPHYFPDLVQPMAFSYHLRRIVDAGFALDAIKKALFYGKPLQGVSDLPASSHHHELDPDIVHGVLGIITEAAELAEWLAKRVETPKLAGAVNLVEEIGDVDWYMTRLKTRLGITDGQVRHINAKKLFTRYPGKFDADSALVRNLSAEQAVLEEEVNKD